MDHKRPPHSKAWQFWLMGGMTVVALIYGAVEGASYLTHEAFVTLTSHAGPNRLISLGVARFQSCKYLGASSTDASLECTIVNTSPNEFRNVSNTSCAAFDSEDRMVHSEDQVIDLANTGMRNGEQRVVRVYAPVDSSVLVCSETGDLGSPKQIAAMQDQLEKDHLITDVKI